MGLQIGTEEKVRNTEPDARLAYYGNGLFITSNLQQEGRMDGDLERVGEKWRTRDIALCRD